MFAIRLAGTLALGSLFAAAPAVASAQAPLADDDLPKRTVSVMVGGLSSEINESTTFGMAAARADFRLSRYVLAEAGVSYARGEVEVGNYTSPTPTFSMETTSLGTATVGIQAELPLRYVRPYVGVASGLYMRLDPEGGHRFLSTTNEFPAGVRVPLTRSLGARGEVRLRYDEQQGNGQELGAEVTFGMSWKF